MVQPLSIISQSSTQPSKHIRHDKRDKERRLEDQSPFFVSSKCNNQNTAAIRFILSSRWIKDLSCCVVCIL